MDLKKRGWISCIITGCMWISAVTPEKEFNPATSCPKGWTPRGTVNGHCYYNQDSYLQKKADYAGAAHACKELHPNARVTSVSGQNEKDFLLQFIYLTWPATAVGQMKLWLKCDEPGACVSARIDSRSSEPQYNLHDNCNQQLHFICEAKQMDLHHAVEQENKILPLVYKRHKYGQQGSPEMELTNLALDQQRRSHNTYEDEELKLSELARDQDKRSHDIEDGDTHARQKRALGNSYNGDNGQVLLTDIQSFQTNVTGFLDGMTNHTNTSESYRREYIEKSLSTVEGLYDRLKVSNLTDTVATGNAMICINTAVTMLGSIGLYSLSLGDDVAKYQGAQGLTMWVNRETMNTHKELTIKDEETEVVIPEEITVTNSNDMLGLVAVMTHEKSFKSLPGSNDTSYMAARIVFVHIVASNNTILPATGHVTIKFSHQRNKKNDEIDVCSNLYTSGEDFVHWSLKTCDEAKYQFSGSITECVCTDLGTYATFQIYDPLVAGLKLLSLLGCAVSLASCLITALVVIGYQLMTTTRMYVRTMFLISLGLSEAVFITGTAWGDVKGVCGIVALWLHFSTLASFCWLLSYTLLLGNELRKEKNYYLDLKLYNLIGWMVPACVVTITAIWRYQDYRDPILCWVSSDGYVYLSFVVPAVIIIAIILLFMLYDLKLLIVKKEEMKKVLRRPVAWSGIRSVFFLLPLLGSTWLFAEYSVITRNLLTQLLFAVFNTALGICIFLFMCHFNAEIRQAKKLRKIVPHSNYTITKYEVPPVDPSYEPTEKYPYPVLNHGHGQEKKHCGDILPGTVDDRGLVTVADKAYTNSKMSTSREGEVDQSRPSTGNDTHTTLLPPDSRAGSDGTQDQQAGSASCKRRPPSGNKALNTHKSIDKKKNDTYHIQPKVN